ncbi:MAG: L-fuculose-phosphate aldolase [Lachnospirales bacterium]
MLLDLQREKIVLYGNRMIENNLTTGSGGNISILDRKHKLIAITPSGILYNELTPKDVIVVDMDGNIVDGKNKPSSEINMHLAVYKNRKDVNSVVHTHSVYATAVACMGWDLEPLHYLIAVAGIEVKCAKYATYGTQELADNAIEALGNRGACLLGNHGLLAVGDSLSGAFSVAEHLEYVAQLTCITKQWGHVNILSHEQIHNVMDKFGTNPYK